MTCVFRITFLHRQKKGMLKFYDNGTNNNSNRFDFCSNNLRTLNKQVTGSQLDQLIADKRHYGCSKFLIALYYCRVSVASSGLYCNMITSLLQIKINCNGTLIFQLRQTLADSDGKPLGN